MIKNSIAIAILALSALFWANSLNARFASLNTDEIKHPIVVELFTSQSCSSCPPADSLLAELAENPNVIPLAFHVTYWNHLHWEDTLSQEFSTNRQRGYQRTLQTRSIYTPQMIVNGKHQFVGSNRNDFNAAIRKTKPLQTIKLMKTAENVIEVTLPKMREDGHLNYTLTLLGTKATETVTMQRGENRGRKVTYTNAVQYIQPLGSWIGNPDTRIITIPPNLDIDSLTLLAQAGGYDEIVAAGRL